MNIEVSLRQNVFGHDKHKIRYWRTIMRKHLATAVAAVSLAMAGQAVYADMNAAKKWIDNEFQPSALSKSDQA